MFFYYSNCKNTIFFLNRFFFCLFYVFLEFNKYDGPMMDGFFFAFFCHGFICCHHGRGDYRAWKNGCAVMF